MTLSRCETITNVEAFLGSHKAIIEAYEERLKKAHPAKKEALERLIEPYRMRLKKYHELNATD